MLYSLFPQSVSKFSLVYLLAWYPPLHTPYIFSPNHCLLFAAHAHTIATCSAVVLRLCPLFPVSLSTLYLELYLVTSHHTSILPFSSLPSEVPPKWTLMPTNVLCLLLIIYYCWCLILLIDSKLYFSGDCENITVKVYQRASLILRCFHYFNVVNARNSTNGSWPTCIFSCIHNICDTHYWILFTCLVASLRMWHKSYSYWSSST